MTVPHLSASSSVTALMAGLFLVSVSAAHAQALPQPMQNVSIHSPTGPSRSLSSQPATTPGDLFHSGTSSAPNLVPNLGLAYDNWPTPEAQMRQLTQGVLSVDFDPTTAYAHKGYEPLKRAHDLGLGAVRLKLNVFAHMNDQGQISPDYLEALETTVNEALDSGMTVVLAEANGYECSKLPGACQAPLEAVWEALGERFRHAPPRLAFELLTEPGGHLTPAKWNALAASLIARVRTSNPLRNLLIAPASDEATSSILSNLNALALPEADRHLILSLGFADPMLANAPVRDAQTFGLEAAGADINEIAAWSRHKDRPILLNEIGTSDAEQMRYRTHWVAGVIRMAQDKGLGWGLGEGARKLGAKDLELRDPETLQQATNRPTEISKR
jgi:endoglucanase